MSKKKRKRQNFDLVFGHIFMSFIALFALYELVFAGECYFASSNIDAYMEDAYCGSCELSEYIMSIGHRHVPYHIFDMDSGKAIGFPQERLNEAGFDPERFERLEGEPMRFVYTKLPRLCSWSSWRVPLAIEYNGENLLPREGMAKLLREEARNSLELAGVIMIIPLFYLSFFLFGWAFELWLKHISRRNRKRKLEKKKQFYAKQELLNEKINSSKGD